MTLLPAEQRPGGADQLAVVAFSGGGDGGRNSPGLTAQSAHPIERFGVILELVGAEPTGWMVERIDRGTRADRPERADSSFIPKYLPTTTSGPTDRGWGFRKRHCLRKNPFICQMPRREAARSRQSRTTAVCRQRLREPAAAKL